MLRITNQMTSARTLLDQFNHLNKMDKIYNDMSSRYKLHRPSDDPIAVARALRLMSEVSVNEMYRQDVLDADSWTSKSDESMRSLNDMMKRIKELTISGASDGKTVEDRKQIQKEIEELKNSCITVANDDFMGRFQFSGYDTTKKFVNKDGRYNTDLYLAGLNYEKINYNIGVGQKTGINLSGVDIFGNEYFHTSTTAKTDIPFDKDKDKSVHLNIDLSIDLQEYDLMNTKYDGTNTFAQTTVDGYKIKGTQTNGIGLDTKINDKDKAVSTKVSNDLKNAKDKVDAAYESLTKLTATGPNATPIKTKLPTVNVKLEGDFKAKDLTDIINKLNENLRKQIPDVQIGQFVNDEGKIGFVSDKNYGAKITVNKAEVTDPITKNVIPSDGSWLPTTNGQMKEPEREHMGFFEMMDRISKFLGEGNTQGLSRMQKMVEAHENNFLACQGKAGARMNMYSIMDSRAQRINLNYRDVLSRVRDTDYNEASMQLSQAYYVYKAALSVSAKILQPSLLDFIR